MVHRRFNDQNGFISFCKRYFLSTILCFFVLAAGCLPGDLFAQNPTLIPANPAAGFYWPYYLYLPSSITNPYPLIVSNNSPMASDDFAYHTTWALEYVNQTKGWADALSTALVVPIWPRPTGDYDGTISMQSLGRGGFEDGIPQELARVDLQLLAIFQDVRTRLLQTRNAITKNKFYIWGASTNGTFTSRFILLHPENIRAADFSGHGWTVPPITHSGTQKLYYPYGLGDVEELTGRPFYLEMFNQIPIRATMGELDNNRWGMHYYIGEDNGMWDATNPAYGFGGWFDTEFGTTSVALMAAAEQIFGENGSIAVFEVYQGVGHEENTVIRQKVLDFFLSVPPIMFPDITGDGALTLADVILSLQLISGMEPVTNMVNFSDVTGDNKVGLPEVINALQKVGQ